MVPHDKSVCRTPPALWGSSLFPQVVSILFFAVSKLNLYFENPSYGHTTLTLYGPTQNVLAFFCVSVGEKKALRKLTNSPVSLKDLIDIIDIILIMTANGFAHYKLRTSPEWLSPLKI